MEAQQWYIVQWQWDNEIEKHIPLRYAVFSLRDVLHVSVKHAEGW
jgi:hypothetical protein